MLGRLPKGGRECVGLLLGETCVRQAAGNRKGVEHAIMLPRASVGRGRSAGGQNVLVKEIIEQFAPRFTPGGYVIYVGDTAEKHLLYDDDYLHDLGVDIDPHGKMPDVVIHHVDRNWLILVRPSRRTVR